MSKKREVKFILRLYSWLRGPSDFFFLFKSNCRSLCFCHPERRGICWESTGTLLSNKEGIFTVSKSAGNKVFFFVPYFIHLLTR